jgi:hypothetical protein
MRLVQPTDAETLGLGNVVRARSKVGKIHDARVWPNVESSYA